MDNIEMNHTSYDVENNQIPIVQEEVTQSQRWIEDTIYDINKWLEWLKLELFKTKEEQEKEVKQLFENVIFEEEIDKYFKKWIKVTKIQEWIFSIISNKTGNLNYYVNREWQILFWIFNIKERPFIENGKAYELAWYIEKKEEWLFNMYKIEWWKEVWSIDIDSKEYYKAWLDIIFYADILNKMVSLKFNDPETKKWIEILVDGWSFKYEDLELFLEKWLITKEIFEYWVEEMKKVILNQCSDERLIKLTWFKWESLWIKESDLKRYLDAWYIDNNLATKCYDVLLDKMG
jgi:hypothetical protein